MDADASEEGRNSASKRQKRAAPLSGLRALKLGRNAFSENQMEFLSGMTSLTELDLWSRDFQATSSSQLATFYRTLSSIAAPGLVKFRFACGISPTGPGDDSHRFAELWRHPEAGQLGSRLCAVLSGCLMLETVVLEMWHCCGVSIREPWESLSRLPCLKELDLGLSILSGELFSDPSASVVQAHSKGLARCTRLTELRVGLGRISIMGCHAWLMLGGICALTGLKSLEISGTPGECEASFDVGAEFAGLSALVKLTRLQLEGVPSEAACTVQIAAGLACMSSMRELVLHTGSFSRWAVANEAGVCSIMIAPVLGALTQLGALTHFAYNSNLRSDAVDALLNVLPKLQSLRFLGFGTAFRDDTLRQRLTAAAPGTVRVQVIMPNPPYVCDWE